MDRQHSPPGDRASSYHIVIVDDHRMAAEAVGRTISSQHTVVGLALNSAEALFCAAEYIPDIFLLDISLGNENGLDQVPRLLAIVPQSAVIS